MKRVSAVYFLVLIALLLVAPIDPPDVFAGLALPSGKLIFKHAQIADPVISSDPAQASPIGVGAVAEGGDAGTLHLALDETGPVDIYFAVIIPEITSEVYILTPTNGLKHMSEVGLIPWKENFVGVLDEMPLGTVLMSSLPQAKYTLVVGVTPHNDRGSYYIWITNIGLAANTIGPTGGRVEDSRGASVVLPEGALSQAMQIGVHAHQSTASLPAPAGGRSFSVRGGASFEPDGLTFSKPVMITIPLSSFLQPGTVVPLFTYDTERDGWRMTEFRATVGPDGLSATAQVTHFTDYIIMASDQGNVDMFFGEFAEKFFDVCNIVPIESLFEAYINGFSAAFPIGDKNIYDFTAHYFNRNYACYETVGVDYVLSAARQIAEATTGEWVTVEEKDLQRETGTKGPVGMVFLYSEDRRISDSNCGEYQMSLQWDVTVYLQCTRPDLALEVPESVKVGDPPAPVTAGLVCGDGGMKGQVITFAVDGDGSLDRDEARTSSGGTAQAMLSGKSEDCSDGEANVTASYAACPGQGILNTDRSALAKILFSLSGLWTATEVADETDCGEGVNTYTSTATISQVGNRVSASAPEGHGSGNKSGCSIVGWSWESEDNGTTTSNGYLNINPDGRSMSGGAIWTWIGIDPETGEQSTCSGSSQLTMTRQK